MGIQTHIYLKSRGAIDFLIECQRNRTMRGLQSRICDAAMDKAWAKMKDLPDDETVGLDLSDLFNIKDFDDLPDKKLCVILNLRNHLNRLAKDNLNLERAYKIKQ